MKKLGVFLLTLASCMALASCGKKDKPTTTAPTTTAPTTTGGGGQQEKTKTTKSYSEIAEALGDKYMFTGNIPYADPDDGEIYRFDVTLAVDKTGTVDKIAMLSTDGGSYFKEFNTSEYMSYDFNGSDNSYDYVSIDSKESVDEIMNDEIEAALSIACNLTIKYTTTESYSFCGRQCTKYLNSYTSGNATINEEYIIDNEIDICLGHTKVSSANPGVFINDATTFTISEFGLTTAVDSCFATQESYIRVKSWDTAFFNSLGIRNKTGYYVDIDDIATHYTGTEVSYKLDSAGVRFADGNKAGCVSCFILEGTDATAKENFANYIMESFYNCGAKYDVLGKERPMVDLINNNKFSAYANQDVQYSVNIEYNPTYTAGKTAIRLTVIDETKITQTDTRTFKQYDLTKILETISNGYKLDVNIPYRENPTDPYILISSSLAYLDGSIIISNPEGKQYFKKIADDTYEFYYIVGEFDEDDEYDGGIPVDQDYVDNEINIEAELSIACGIVIDYKVKVVNFDYAGRICTKLVTTEGDVYIFDNITGICLCHSKNNGDVDNSTFNTTGYILNDFVDHTDLTKNPVTAFFNAEDEKAS